MAPYKSKTESQQGERKTDKPLPQTGDQTDKQTEKQAGDKIGDQTEKQTEKQAENETGDKTEKQTGDQIEKQTEKQTDDKTGEQTENQTGDQTKKLAEGQTEKQIGEQTAEQTGEQQQQQKPAKTGPLRFCTLQECMSVMTSWRENPPESDATDDDDGDDTDTSFTDDEFRPASVAVVLPNTNMSNSRKEGSASNKPSTNDVTVTESDSDYFSNNPVSATASDNAIRTCAKSTDDVDENIEQEKPRDRSKPSSSILTRIKRSLKKNQKFINANSKLIEITPTVLHFHQNLHGTYEPAEMLVRNNSDSTIAFKLKRSDNVFDVTRRMGILRPMEFHTIVASIKPGSKIGGASTGAGTGAYKLIARVAVVEENQLSDGYQLVKFWKQLPAREVCQLVKVTCVPLSPGEAMAAAADTAAAGTRDYCDGDNVSTMTGCSFVSTLSGFTLHSAVSDQSTPNAASKHNDQPQSNFSGFTLGSAVSDESSPAASKQREAPQSGFPLASTVSDESTLAAARKQRDAPQSKLSGFTLGSVVSDESNPASKHRDQPHSGFRLNSTVSDQSTPAAASKPRDAPQSGFTLGCTVSEESTPATASKHRDAPQSISAGKDSREKFLGVRGADITVTRSLDEIKNEIFGNRAIHSADRIDIGVKPRKVSSKVFESRRAEQAKASSERKQEAEEKPKFKIDMTKEQTTAAKDQSVTKATARKSEEALKTKKMKELVAKRISSIESLCSSKEPQEDAKHSTQLKPSAPDAKPADIGDVSKAHDTEVTHSAATGENTSNTDDGKLKPIANTNNNEKKSFQSVVNSNVSNHEKKGFQRVVNAESRETKGFQRVVNAESSEKKGFQRVVNAESSEKKGFQRVVNAESSAKKGFQRVSNTLTSNQDKKASQNVSNTDSTDQDKKGFQRPPNALSEEPHEGTRHTDEKLSSEAPDSVATEFEGHNQEIRGLGDSQCAKKNARRYPAPCKDSSTKQESEPTLSLHETFPDVHKLKQSLSHSETPGVDYSYPSQQPRGYALPKSEHFQTDESELECDSPRLTNKPSVHIYRSAWSHSPTIPNNKFIKKDASSRDLTRDHCDSGPECYYGPPKVARHAPFYDYVMSHGHAPPHWKSPKSSAASMERDPASMGGASASMGGASASMRGEPASMGGEPASMGGVTASMDGTPASIATMSLGGAPVSFCPGHQYQLTAPGSPAITIDGASNAGAVEKSVEFTDDSGRITVTTHISTAGGAPVTTVTPSLDTVAQPPQQSHAHYLPSPATILDDNRMKLRPLSPKKKRSSDYFEFSDDADGEDTEPPVEWKLRKIKSNRRKIADLVQNVVSGVIFLFFWSLLLAASLLHSYNSGLCWEAPDPEPFGYEWFANFFLQDVEIV